MGTASGLVAALVAAAFVALVSTVRDQRRASDRGATAALVAADAGRTEALAFALQRSSPAPSGQPRATASQLDTEERALQAIARADPQWGPAAATIQRAVNTYLRAPGASRAGAPSAASGQELAALYGALDGLASAAARAADQQRQQAHSLTSRAELLAIAGLIGSTLLIAALTTYLSQYIVVPLRRVRNAARRLAKGDLSARVVEEGDAEPRELARAFNTMAASLQHSRQELESQNAELAGQRQELERTLGDLAAEKRRVEVFYRAGEQLAAELDLDALGEVALGELADAAGADVGALYVADEPEAPLALLGVRGLDPGTLPAELRPTDGLAGRALSEGRAISGEHPEGALSLVSWGRDVDVRHELHVPLRRGDRAIGVISLGRLGAGGFAYEQVETVERLTDQAAVALANVLSYRRAVRQARINRAVLDASPDAIGLFGVGGEAVVENAPMAALRSQGAGDVPDGAAENEVRDELAADGRTYARYAAPVRDGAGALMGRLVVLRDVTAEREAERLKDEFFALVSHELRTPLTSIIGYLELVLDDADELPEDSRRYLEVVERNAKRLLLLVGDMLFVAQVEAGRLSLERSAVDMATVAAQSVEAARPAAEREGVRLGLQTASLAPVYGDAERFGQLLDNLISNAIKFTPREGSVTVRLGHAGQRAVIEVSDTGHGILPEEQEHLFERFYRASSATERAVPGAGLGLTIVKTIAEAHGGAVTVSSSPGAGATFRVELPYGEAHASDGAGRSSRAGAVS
jgi:signal transduction histidine kinase/HAMP domain-containing protein